MKTLSGSILIILSFILVGFNVSAAKTVSKKPDASEVLRKAQEAFLDYEFDEASDLLEEYESLQEKAKKPLSPEFHELQRQLLIANNAYGRVQNIVILDSINVPRSTFFSAYKLAPSAGKIGRGSSFIFNNGLTSNELSFLNEDGDYFITSVPDENGELSLIESRGLLDGEWVNMEVLEGDFEKTGDYAYPFMSGDGQTFYFANNGEESMGGFDIFVAQKEAITGETLQPLNIGMPFNSPYDDFMMVIDEETGVGWWATDRNSPGGDVTVYLYVLDDIRKNYPSDTDNLKNFARISEYKITQNPEKGEEYKKILDKIKKL